MSSSNNEVSPVSGNVGDEGELIQFQAIFVFAFSKIVFSVIQFQFVACRICLIL